MASPSVKPNTTACSYAREPVRQAGVARQRGMRVDDVLPDLCEQLIVRLMHDVSRNRHRADSTLFPPGPRCRLRRLKPPIPFALINFYRIHYPRDTFPT